MPKEKSIYALTCAGGGAHGAYQVGALKYIHEHFSDGEHSPFSIFSGSSCGSLNTTFYAAQSFDARASRLWLEELWMSFHVPAYHGNFLKNASLSFYREWRKHPRQRHPVWGLLDTKPMQDIIEKGFVRRNLERALAEGSTRGVAVTATEILSGRCCWFLEGAAAAAWNLFHSVGILDKITSSHITASCSVPVFLPPVKIGGRYFLDGALMLSRPFSGAISMGANRILNIATDKPLPGELPIYPHNFKPRLSNVIRLLLGCLSHDTTAADEAVQLEMFNRFSHSLSRKSRREGRNMPPLPLFHHEALPSHYHPIEVYLLYPSRRIRESSIEIETGGPRRKPTRFMFHRKFVRELIDLGYEDTRSKHGELKKFFSTNRRTKRWLHLFKR